MSQRQSQRSHALSAYEPGGGSQRKERSRCITAICMSWKFFTCVFSHVMLVALVVSYCILGAYTFEKLEGENERQVKQGIPRIRDNLTEAIWKYTTTADVLRGTNWTDEVYRQLQNFEAAILDAMKKEGWDGNEDMNQMQWTFAGSLFYSIIVITTIGYGHIAPKTSYGKVTTIFYAILGIPLMLLCLSNIGDIMASSFRFLYWRVCCFVCTREPKRPRRSRSMRGTIRQSAGRTVPRGSVRRPERFSQRSHDSGIVPWAEPSMAHAYSDTDLRYSFMERSNYHLPDIESRGSAKHQQPHRFSKESKDRFTDRHTVERERNVGKSSNRYHDDESMSQNRKFNTTGRINKDSQTPKSRRNSRSMALRSQSLDRKAHRETPDLDFDRENAKDSNIVCNKYALDELQRGTLPRQQRHSNRDRFQNRVRQNHNRSQSVPRPVAGNQLELPSPSPPRRTQSSYNQYNDYDFEEGDMELQPMRRSPRRKPREAALPPSPRIMSPLGFQTHRQARYEDLPFYDDDPDYYDLPPRSRPVPIWLCVFLVVSYIIAGAFIFNKWENWSLLDSAYFCFITLTTIGFGDFVPAQGVKTNSEVSIAQCSLYLLFGIALLAMSFNLVQEEVIANVKGIARRLGILKEEEIND